VSLLLIAVAVLWPARARGGGPTPEISRPPEVTTPAPPAAPAPAPVLSLVRRGNRLHELGRFAEALVLYERAYELYPRPAWLFNIAQCHRELGHHVMAIRTYELYLAKGVHQAASPEEVRTLIALSQRALLVAAARQATPAGSAAASSATPTPERRPFYKTWWFWTLVGVAAGGITAGAVVGARRVCVAGTTGCP
jgi:hypothetical protein